KNVLSTFFWMLTLLAYERFARRPDLLRYLLVFASLALGLMAKPMLVTLPFVMLLLDYWPLGRTNLWRPDPGSSHEFQPVPFSRLVLEKIPLLGLSAASIAISCLAAEKTGGFVDAIPMGLRLSNAVASYGVYLWQAIWPQSLSVFYPFPESVPLWKVAGSGGLIIALTALFLGYARRRPYLLAGWLWYLGTLIPVLGIVQHGLWPAVADRYAYIPLVGLFMIVAFGIAEISKAAVFSNRTLKNTLLFGAAGLILATLVICSWQQLSYWRGSTALFERAIAVTKDNWVARYNLGTALEKRGEYQNAVTHLTEAVRIKPSFAKAHYNLGCSLDGQGRHERALEHYKEAARLRPDYVEAYNNLGISLAILGRNSEARKAFLEALKINPKDIPARKNLQRLLRRSQGKP
ncbi:MAG: tetratricopeptide repeat protein, partial [Thermodesulfobacteriota bacterium]|nr:tetratricopeptide repeat protein [Thermodesulfobacteriota bacterium]